MIENLETVLVGMAGPVILGVFGFLWKVNSKLSSIEQRQDALDRRVTTNSTKLQSHFEKAFTIRKNADP
jgi:hypothetical protein